VNDDDDVVLLSLAIAAAASNRISISNMTALSWLMIDD
jgi:hypothetical protein